MSGQVLHETGVTGKGKGSSGDMDVDMDYGFTSTPTPKYGFAGGSDQYEGDVVIQIRMTVVSEDRLEGAHITCHRVFMLMLIPANVARALDAKAKYEKVTSMHVYSLSPSPIRVRLIFFLRNVLFLRVMLGCGFALCAYTTGEGD